MIKITAFLLIFFTAIAAFCDDNNAAGAISGTVTWSAQTITAVTSLDMAANGIRLPTGRTYAETLLKTRYVNLIQPSLLEIQVDSSSTIGDLVNKGDLTLRQIEALALGANSVAPSLSSDLRRIQATHTISLASISASLLRHSRPIPVTRTLNPVSTAQYTGIIIIATDELPIHGMRSATFAIPCLFPKIWDSEMNLIYERSMLETTNTTMVRYSPAANIFMNNPSGLSADLQAIVGERPLRIFARGVFGIKPTDLIIDRSDALLIISSEENRRLLSEGKVVFILEDTKLVYNINGE